MVAVVLFGRPDAAEFQVVQTCDTPTVTRCTA